MKKALYDTFDYPGYWQGREYEDQAEKIALKRFLMKIPPEKRKSLVDIGGGYGRLAEIYAPLFKKCLLIDPSKRLLKQAQIKLQNDPQVEFKEGRIEDLPAKDGQFDVALLVRVVHHLPYPKKAFLEAYRVLKEGGFLILEFANKIHFLACLRAWNKNDFVFRGSLAPINQAIKTEQVVFLNHHPQLIKRILEKIGFRVLEGLSVSNFRHGLCKKLIPQPLLLKLETLTQKPLFGLCFGPSLFLLCEKH